MHNIKRFNLSPIQVAAFLGHFEVCKYIIGKIANRNPKYALPFSAYKGHLEICRLLIENGADTNSRNKKEETPLHLSALKGHLEICRPVSYTHLTLPTNREV